MKYFSEELNKNFDTEEECKQAEAEYKEKKEKEETALAERKSAISKKKKELSDSIKVADDDVREAYKKLEQAKKEASDILKEARKSANDIIKEASNNVDIALSNRRDLIASFNKEFGPYMVTYTGDKVEEEYKRIVHQIRDIFDFNPFSFSFHWPF